MAAAAAAAATSISSRQRPAHVGVSIGAASPPHRTSSVGGGNTSAADVQNTNVSSMPTSKSQQLARALASAQGQTGAAASASPQFRPDSLWSEGGADVVWQGKGSASTASPNLAPSNLHSGNHRAGRTDMHEQDIGDAEEGRSESDEMHSASADDNTTFTTLSTSDSGAKRGLANASFQSSDAFNMPTSHIKAPPARPQRKAPRPPMSNTRHSSQHDMDGQDDEMYDNDGNDDEADAEDAHSHYGHARNTSVGSSIWAGRGAKSNNITAADNRPPMPALPTNGGKSPLLDSVRPRAGGGGAGRASIAETSSVYSQGGATPDMNDNATSDAQRMLEQTPPLDRLRQFATTFESPKHGGSDKDAFDEFEMMDTQSMYEGRSQSVGSSSAAPPESVQPLRRLPDGTVVPKMPPMPSQHQNRGAFEGKPRSRSQRGRRNRSPILSYADGEEEERRLVQESELREHGGIETLTTTSSLGPRLKKNSPAPWEMDDDADRFLQADAVSPGMPASRPSMENFLAAAHAKNPSQWARQSMETFRNRSLSSGGGNVASTGQQTSHGPSSKLSTSPFPSSNSHHGSSPLANGGGSSSDASYDINGASGPSEESSRRTRTKSVSSSAAGMLKGLGLASSASTAPTKKSSSSRLAKAFRSSSKSNAKDASAANESSSSRKQAPISLARGISSDDYAHLPTSPQLNNNSTLSVGNSPYMGGSSVNSHSSLSHRSETGTDANGSASQKNSPGLPYLGSTSPVPPTQAPQQMPLRKTSVGAPATNSSTAVNNSSLDGHSASSHAAAKGASSEPASQMRILTTSSRGSSETMADSSAPHTPSVIINKSHSGNASLGSPTGTAAPPLKASPIPYKNSAGFGAAERISPGMGYAHAFASCTPPKSSVVKAVAGPGGPTAENNGRVSVGSGHRSQDSHRSASNDANKPSSPRRSNSTTHEQLPGAGAGTGAAAAAASMRMPVSGAHEGTPYKLISLDQARQQQQLQNRQPLNVAKARDDFIAEDPMSTSGERTLKGKKSGGFLRRFGKEKGDMASLGGGSNGGDGFGPLPSFGPSIQLQQAQQREQLGGNNANHVAAPPTLSVRPMSSMFSGLSAAGLLDAESLPSDSLQAQSGEQYATMTTTALSGSTDQLTPSTAGNAWRGQSRTASGGLSPRSPAITVASVDSAPSAGDYYDALERSSPVIAPGMSLDSNNAKSAIAATQSHLGVGGAQTTRSGYSSASPTSAALPTRRSTDSMRSDSSSALGLVNGFPALPATGHGATVASLTSKANAGVNGETPSLARATRQRALEIEAKMSELAAELQKLRAFAVDSGLARTPVMAATTTSTGDALQDATGTADVVVTESAPTTPAMTSFSGGGRGAEEDVGVGGGAGGTDSLPQSPSSSVSALQTPIPPCAQCGCACADQKRLQSLNELAVLKGISVLDRGRALKPISGQNGSKFGGYLDR